ncbi:TlpA disulfide reductase family protein [Sphingomonas sp.]|uniref:TlpA family protein disulfide reductase n=1 Tax=Sphingomonas sp. TaxID=28214 RepID=UPI0031D14043
MAAAGGDAERIGTLDRSHKGEPAPSVTFQSPDGKPTTLAAFKGKPLLLNLWATWCAPCVREMPMLDRLAQREGARLQVLTVSQDLEGAAKVAPFFAKAGFKALQPWLDPDVGLSTHYGVNLPTTVLYDAQGREVWRVSGDMDWDGETAKGWLAEAN